MQDFLETLDLPIISAEERLVCETEVNTADLKNDLFSIEDNKSPGNHDITK